MTTTTNDFPENHNSPCPKCGYCPACGRSNAPAGYYPYPVYPYNPVPYYPYWGQTAYTITAINTTSQLGGGGTVVTS